MIFLTEQFFTGHGRVGSLGSQPHHSRSLGGHLAAQRGPRGYPAGNLQSGLYGNNSRQSIN